MFVDDSKNSIKRIAGKGILASTDAPERREQEESRVLGESGVSLGSTVRLGGM